MAKKKEIEDLENDFFQELSKNVGGELLDDISNCPGFIDTGILACNFINSGRFVGGGIPIGSMCEVSGESATGKSLLGTNLLRGCQTYGGISVFHDAEFAISKDFAIKASHVDPKRLIVTSSDCLEGSFNKIHKVIRWIRDEKKISLEKPICVIFDSIAAAPSEREFNQTQHDVEELSADKLKALNAGTERPGERAKICSLELRKLMPVVKQNNAIVFFVNQLRSKIGAGLYEDPNVEAGGGRGLKFYCSTRMRLYSSKQLKDENKRTIGMNVMIKNIKSRFTGAHQSISGVKLFFDNGIDPFGGLLDLLTQIGRITSPSAGNFVINEKYTFDEQPYKFKSSKASNTVPIEVLLKNPKLVDADNIDQIKYYVDMFGKANEIAGSNLIEEDIKSSDEID